jgi:hypothetical protein
MMGRLTYWLPRLVARAPAKVHAKLLVAFLAIVILLIAVGAVGLQVLSHSNRRATALVELQRKIAAYRQLQHTPQPSSTAWLRAVGPRRADARRDVRQLSQFGYDFDRLQFVAKDEVELLGQVRKDYDQFIQVVSQSVELIAPARSRQKPAPNYSGQSFSRTAGVMNQLVNRAEADMVASTKRAKRHTLTRVGS